MTTMSQNVIEEDMVDRLRREMRNGTAFSEVKEEISAKADDVVNYVSTPLQEVFYDAPVAKAYALGVLTGAALVLIAHLVG